MYAIEKLNTKALSEKCHGINGSDEKLSFPMQDRESTWKDVKPRSFCQGSCSSAHALSFRIYILALNGTLDGCTVIYCLS